MSDESEEESSDDEVEDVEVDTGDGVLRIKKAAFDELKQLDNRPEEDGHATKGKGVFEMKFMKDAAARQNVELDREIDDFRRELGDDDAGSDDNDISEDDIPSHPHRLNGRLVFQPGPQVFLYSLHFDCELINNNSLPGRCSLLPLHPRSQRHQHSALTILMSYLHQSINPKM